MSLWAYDSTANEWTMLDEGKDAPEGRLGHTVVYDPSTNKVIMFGGKDQEGGFLNDTWQLVY